MDVTKNIVKQPDELPDEAAAVLERKCCVDPSVDDVFEGQISDKKSDCFDEDGVCDPFSYISIPGMCSAIFKAKFLKKIQSRKFCQQGTRTLNIVWLRASILNF